VVSEQDAFQYQFLVKSSTKTLMAVAGLVLGAAGPEEAIV